MIWSDVRVSVWQRQVRVLTLCLKSISSGQQLSEMRKVAFWTLLTRSVNNSEILFWKLRIEHLHTERLCKWNMTKNWTKSKIFVRLISVNMRSNLSRSRSKSKCWKQGNKIGLTLCLNHKKWIRQGCSVSILDWKNLRFLGLQIINSLEMCSKSWFLLWSNIRHRSRLWVQALWPLVGKNNLR